MTARDSIAMHSQRGILRNTRDLPRPNSPAMALHHKKYTKTTTDALGKLEGYAPGEAPGNIGILTPFSSPFNANDAMAKANAWGLEIQQGHATDFMQEIDALDWRIKDDTTTRRGDYIRKRATFLADATELEFRRNRWSYQRSEENAHIQGDKKLTLNGGHAAMSLQKTNAHNIAMLLATRSAQGRIILRAQADERGQQHTQAILSPASFSLAHIPSSAQKASARLDMKDAFATMSTNEAKLILEADTACLEGNGSKITCSARGIALEPANGEISLADILFSGNQIKGARNGILTLAGGAIKIAGANAAVQEQGNAPVQAAAQFVREQENAQPEDTLAAALQDLFDGGDRA